MQVFADRIEFCWIHLRGIGALENSLWAYDGQGMRVWLNALAIESSPSMDGPHRVKESVNIPLDFYPLCAYSQASITRLISTFTFSCTYGQGNYHRGRIRVDDSG